MTCTETRDLFSALADDALTPGERAALDAHLAGCAECRRELAGLLRTVKLVRAMDPVHAPAGFVDRVLAAAQPAPAHRRLGRRLMRPWPTLPLGAAALLLIGGLAVLLFRGSPEQQRAAHDQLEAARAPSSERDVAAPRSVEAPPAAVTAAPRSADLSKNYSETAAPTTKTDAPSPRARAERAQATVPNASRDSVSSAREQEAQQRLTPPAAMERRDAKRELADRGQEALAPAVGGRSAAAPSAAERQPPPPVGAAATPAPAMATAKAQAMPQSAPLSRTGPMTGIPAAPPDVTARLRVAHVSGAERALIELAARVGGRQTGRRIDGGRLVVELAVPRDTYAEFVREAAALGAVSIESQATDRPMLAVAVTVSN